MKSLASLASVLAPALILGVVWWPEFAHDYVPAPSIPAQTIASARSNPDDGLLQELTDFVPGFGLRVPFAGDAELLAAADGLLAGRVNPPRYPQVSITVPFSAEDVDRGPASWLLAFAGLTLPDVLIRAYLRTHDDRYLFGARDMIMGWADVERQIGRAHV